MIGFRDFTSPRALGHAAFAVIGGAAIALAAPATAAPGESPASYVATGAGANGTAAPAARRDRAAHDGDRRICVRDAHTGTRIPRQVCKTEAEWEAAGGLDLDRVR